MNLFKKWWFWMIVILLIVFFFPKKSDFAPGVFVTFDKYCNCIGFERIPKTFIRLDIGYRAKCFGIPVRCKCTNNVYDNISKKIIKEEVKCNLYNL